MQRLLRYLPVVPVLILGASAALAQGLPKSQPKLITVVREEVKVGRAAAHAKHEAGWPAAYAKANSPASYLALVSMTGPQEVWYVAGYESYGAIGESMKREEKDPVLSAELDRLALADAEFIDRLTNFDARARPDLSLGEFPDIAKARFFEISVFKVRTGKDMIFEEVVKAYGAARKRVAPKSSYRTYQVTAGISGSTYLIFSSFENYADFDVLAADVEKTFAGATQDEDAKFAKWDETLIVSETVNRYRLDPLQSYVPKEVRATDPEFWQPK